MLRDRLFRLQVGCLAAMLAAGSAWAGPQGASESERAGARVSVSSSGGGSFLGVNIWEVNTEVARKMKLAEERGIIITSVVPHSAADEAGLHKGDVVLEFNGQTVEGVKQFIRLVREVPPGRKCSISIVRAGEEMEIGATMGDKRNLAKLAAGEVQVVRVPNFQVQGIVIPDVPHVYTTWRSVKLGIIGESLDTQLAEYFGVEEGVLVRSVVDDTPASEAGLKAGDVIVAVGGATVATPREVSSALQERVGEKLELSIVRERQKRAVSVMLSEGAGGGELRMRRPDSK
jgi:serine protease Do